MPFVNKEKDREYRRNYRLKYHHRRMEDDEYRQRYRGYAMARYDRMRKIVQDFKSGKACVKCGENHPACLVFHHRDPSTKLFNIGNYNKAAKAIHEEIAKYDLLCANCHLKLHAEARTAVS